MRRLVHEIGQRLDIGGKLARMAGETGGIFGKAGDGEGVKIRQALSAGRRGDEAREQHRGPIVARDHVVEIRDHLEMLAEFGVGISQEVIQHPLADQHHLKVAGNRFRLQQGRGGQAERAVDRLDPDFARPQSPFERLPGGRLGQHLARIEQQVAAIRPVQGAGADEIEIGHQRAELGPVLDPADQTLEGRLVLIDHGGMGRATVIDDEIDPIAPESIFGARLGSVALIAGAVGGPHDRIDILDHVLADLVEIAHHLVDIGEQGLEPVDHVADREACRLLVERADLLAGLLEELGEVLDGRLKLFLQLFDALFELLALAGIELLEIVRRNDLAVVGRREGITHGRADQRDVLLAGGLLDLLHRALLAFLELVLDDPAAGAVFVARKGRAERAAQVVDQSLHRRLQFHALAGGQADGVRLLGFLEVIDVAPVGRYRGLLRLGIDIGAHDPVAANPGGPEREQIVSGLGHAEAELDRLHGAVLADDLGEIL